MGCRVQSRKVECCGGRVGSAPMVPLATTAQPAAADLGRLQRAAPALSPPNTPNHASVRGAEGLIGVTFGKSRMRESRTYGSVRAKAKWLSYSTILAQPP